MAAPEVVNTAIKVDLSELRTAADEYVKLMGIQVASLDGLQVAQVKFNKENDTARAVVDKQIDAHRKITLVLEQEAGKWNTMSATIKKHTAELTEAEKAAKALAKAEADTAKEAEKAAKEQARELRRYKKMIDDDEKKKMGGPKTTLGIGDFVRIAEATLFKTALTGVKDAMLEGLAVAKDYQIQISLIRTVSQDAQLATSAWAEGLKDVSNATGFALMDVSKAAYEVIQSQVVQGAQTFNFLKTSADLARTTGVDLTKTADLLSSTIQGFKLSITDADHTAAVLFKTVELGRIKVDELSNTLGRVAAPAGLLGIRLEEVGAALSTLTRQGIKTSDATTLVTNIISKMAKPTESMKKLLQSWGFETGQAAVKTLGFVEVLRRLESTTEGRLGDLAELFNELRGLRGAAGLTSAFGDYEADLKKLDDADKTYKEAINIRAESSADKLKKWGNEVKNTFVTAYGEEAVQILANIVNALGGAENATKTFANGILVAGAAFIGMRVAVFAYTTVQAASLAITTASAAAIAAKTIATAAETAAIAAGATATQAATVYQLEYNAAKAAYIPTAAQGTAATAGATAAMAFLVVGVGAAVGIYAALNREIKNNITDFSDLNRMYDENQKARGSSGNGKSDAQVNLEAYTAQVGRVFDMPLKLNAQALIEVNKAIEANQADVKRAADMFGISYKASVEVAHNAIKKMNSDIAKSKHIIEQSGHAMQKMRESLDDSIRRVQNKYATDDQKRILNAQRVMQLYKEAEDLYKKGDEDSVKAARDKLKDIAQIFEQDFELQQDMAKKQLEEALRRDPTLGMRPGGNVLAVSTIPLQSAYNDLLAKQDKWEKELIKNEEKKIAAKEKSKSKLEEETRKYELAVKNYLDFDAVKDGKVQDQFMTAGKADPKKIRDELMRLSREVLQAQPGTNYDEKDKSKATAETLDMWIKMAERGKQIALEANLQANKGMIVQDQDRLTRMKDSYLVKYKEIMEEGAKFSAEFFSPKGTLDQMKGDASGILQLTDQKFPLVEKMFQMDPRKQRVRKDIVAEQEAAREDNAKYQAAMEKVRTNATKGKGGEMLPRKEDLEEAGVAFQKVYERAQRIASLLGGNKGKDVNDPSRVNPDDFVITGADGRQYRLGDMKEAFDRKYWDSHQKNRDARQGTDGKIDMLKGELERFYTEAVVPLEKAFPNLAETIKKEAKPAVLGFYGDLVNQNSDAILQVQKLQKAYEDLKKIAPPKIGPDGKPVAMNDANPQTTPVNAMVNPQAQLGDNDAQYFATGGYIHPGEAKGSDTIPAWLSPGEFIMNAASTKKFYAQLVDMNRGVSPRYYARGGYVTTNVGDVHVHMESNTQPSASRVARQMGQELRREIRRGNVKLN